MADAPSYVTLYRYIGWVTVLSSVVNVMTAS